MDEPDLDVRRHERALEGLGRMNALSRSAATLWDPIRGFAMGMKDRPLRILDLASGGGDGPLRLWRRAARAAWAWRSWGWISVRERSRLRNSGPAPSSADRVRGCGRATG